LISSNYVTFLTEKQEILWFSYNAIQSGLFTP